MHFIFIKLLIQVYLICFNMIRVFESDGENKREFTDSFYENSLKLIIESFILYSIVNN